MRPSWSQSSLGFLLKFLNYLQSFVGVSIVLYSVWLLSLWRRRSSDLHEPTIPWLVWTLMGFGILALSLVLAMLLRNMVLPRRLEDESNEDIPVSRKPLLGPRPDASTSIDRRISDDSLISQIRQKFGFESGQISEDVGENRFPQLATMPRS
ncbi:hypothetical protein ACMD2_01936 [Ananas comosus]|uniref:Uncharacterized protein n=1 Tax=Ananas comosus TaxID=4615 RepID=A0A199UJ28_ANACO|nr:hypothetical protein ACMD2_01936 [Ananas comosus]